jgi:hypothetical protein
MPKFPVYWFKALVLIVSFLSTLYVSGQDFEDLPNFGQFTGAEIDLNKCDFDPEANAVVLMDVARSTYNDEYNLVTERRIRIKILNEKGFDKATVSILYYHKDNYEFISQVSGVITNYDNKNRPTTTELDRKSIFDVKVNDRFSNVRFTMPNVKAGSIFEYRYTSTMKNYGGLDEWVFQADIPTIRSRYHLFILPNTEFTYQVSKLPIIPINVKRLPMDGSVVFEMEKIAGLRD